MGLFSDIKITTIYYYVQSIFKNDSGLVNIFNLSSDWNFASQHLRCRQAYYDEIALMAINGLVFDKGLICVAEGYYIWDSVNKMYLLIDVNSGVI